jgi:hypothetical protein
MNRYNHSHPFMLSTIAVIIVTSRIIFDVQMKDYFSQNLFH